MSKSRTPQFTDSDASTDSELTRDLEQRLTDSGQQLAQAYSETVSSIKTDKPILNILVVDDNQLFLDSVAAAAEGFSIHVTTVQPKCVEDTRDKILEIFNSKQNLDCLLLDFAYAQLKFDGLDILKTLRPLTLAASSQTNSDNATRLQYLPVAIVTHGGSDEYSVNAFDPDEALGSGADKVYSEKGFGSGITNLISLKGDKTILTATPLLQSLLTGGLDEMRFRAWARLWRDIRNRLEDQIKSHLDSNDWLEDRSIEKALRDIWKIVADPMIEAGYASHLCMRILECNDGNNWELKMIGTTDTENCPNHIAWNAIPLFKDCLSEQISEINIIKKLSESSLVSSKTRGDKNINIFKKYTDCSAMMTRLDSRISPIGTFLITRDRNQSPFSDEDKANLHITVQRLGLFYREMYMRQRHHERQMALVSLGEQLVDESSEDKIVSEAVKVLHKYLHEDRSAFRVLPEKNPAKQGRVTIRLIEPGTGRLMRPDQRNLSGHQSDPVLYWGRGFDVENHEPEKITIFESEVADVRYYREIIEGKPQFHPDVNNTEDSQYHSSSRTRPKNLIKSKMIAPIMAGKVVIGTVNVEHQLSFNYGKDEDASADFALLKAVALEVGQALRAFRAKTMLRKLLELHKSTAEHDQEQVIADFMSTLYFYTGCAVGIWAEPENDTWKISKVWECPQGYETNAYPATEFRNDHKWESSRLHDWKQHLEGDNFSKTLIAKTVISGKDFLYAEQGFLDDQEMGIHTLSQAVMILREPHDTEAENTPEADSATKKILGVFSFLFNQKPGLDEMVQRPLLEEASNFAASYLSIRNKQRLYLQNSIIMEQQASLGMAYQQLRHSLKLQLGGVNGKLDRLLINPSDNSLVQKLKGFLSNISNDIDISKTMMKYPELQHIDLKQVWNRVRSKLSNTPLAQNVEIKEMTESVWANGDKEIVDMVFHNLIQNAMEAIHEHGTGEITCLPIPNNNAEYCQVAIRDTGPGLQPEIADRIFNEIGVSDKPTGTGFGTYFSAYLLRRSGAEIRHDPSYEDGTQFLLRFPAVSNNNA